MLEKVHGMQATAITLNERFTMLASAAADRPVRQSQPRRRPFGPNRNFFNQNNTFRSQRILQQIAWQLERQAKIQALRQRIGNNQGNFRRYGSEGNLPGLRRSNSFGNLNRVNIRNRVGWRQSSSNLSHMGSFTNLADAVWRGRGLGRGGGRGRGLGRGRGAGQGLGRRGGAGRALRGRFRGNTGGARQRQGAAPQLTRVGLRSDTHARGRGMQRQQQKPVPSKEELDNELDQYMACTKSALDNELDEYMNQEIEME